MRLGRWLSEPLSKLRGSKELKQLPVGQRGYRYEVLPRCHLPKRAEELLHALVGRLVVRLGVVGQFGHDVSHNH